jgi:hypothetical protein
MKGEVMGNIKNIKIKGKSPYDYLIMCIINGKLSTNKNSISTGKKTYVTHILKYGMRMRPPTIFLLFSKS